MVVLVSAAYIRYTRKPGKVWIANRREPLPVLRSRSLRGISLVAEPSIDETMFDHNLLVDRRCRVTII